MTTAMPLTLSLLVVIGVYELAAGIAGIAGRINWPTMLDEFDRSPALSFISGFIVYVLGAVVLLLHNTWTDPLAIIVSAAGWIVTVEGLLIMTVPKPLLAFSRRLVANQRLISTLAAILGLLLVGLGLLGRANSATY